MTHIDDLPPIPVCAGEGVHGWTLKPFGIHPLLILAVYIFLPNPEAVFGSTPIGIYTPQFTDVTPVADLAFRHRSGNAEKDYIIDVNGSGTALFDYDNDGDLDIYLVNGAVRDLPEGEAAPVDRLYRNDGGWAFTDVTGEAGLGDAEWGCGCAVADIDNDGDLDLYVTNWGPNRLYKNNGDGTFSECGTGAGVANPAWGAGCAFGDFDRDGFVDLYVTNYIDFDPKTIPARGMRESCTLGGSIPVFCGPKGLPALHDSFYRNNGDGTFSDISEASGIRSVEKAYGLGVLFLDVNLDGLPDIFVANDQYPNYLFQNLGDGTFEETGLLSGLSYNAMGEAQSCMGVDCGDLDGDGLEDIFVLNYEKEYNTFYRNDGGGFFTDITKEAGMYYTSFHQLGWGTLFLDAEYDGDLDLFITNGHVMPQVDQTRAMQGYNQLNQLLLNDGKGRFTDVSGQAGSALAVKLSSRGCAFGDLDGDGDQDIVINNIDEQATICENANSSGNHWIGVELEGVECNRNGLGSWIIVKTPEREHKRYHRGAFGYASQSELTVRFGLGTSERVEWIKVQWLGGNEEQFNAPGIDRVVRLKQGAGL